MKKKKKRNIGSEQLSHGRGTKELRCITMLWVKKKKKGDAGPIFGCETAVQFVSATDLSHWLLQ